MAALGFGLFFTNPFIVNELLKLWEKDVKPVAQTAHHDIGIVLGGIIDIKPPTKDRIYFSGGADRLLQAIWLYDKGKIDKILITGGAAAVVGDKIPEAPMLKKFLLICGIPEDDIYVEAEARNTHENALFSSELIEKRAPDAELLLITSAFHMRRAEACFNKVNLEVTPFPVDYVSATRSFMPQQLFIPSADALGKWETLLHEIVGFLGYQLMGYI